MFYLNAKRPAYNRMYLTYSDLKMAFSNLCGWLMGTEVSVISNIIPWARNLAIMRSLVFTTYIDATELQFFLYRRQVPAVPPYQMVPTDQVPRSLYQTDFPIRSPPLLFSLHAPQHVYLLKTVLKAPDEGPLGRPKTAFIKHIRYAVWPYWSPRTL